MTTPTDNNHGDALDQSPARGTVEQLLSDLRNPDMLNRAVLGFAILPHAHRLGRLVDGNDHKLEYCWGTMLLSALQHVHRSGGVADGVLFMTGDETTPAWGIFRRYPHIEIEQWDARVGPVPHSSGDVPYVVATYVFHSLCDSDAAAVRHRISYVTAVDGSRTLRYQILGIWEVEPVDESNGPDVVDA